MAIFPREQYQGTMTTDLFADEETRYYDDDVDQFFALQNAEINAVAEEKGMTAAFVAVFRSYTVPWWQFREARENEPSGVGSICTHRAQLRFATGWLAMKSRNQ